MLDEAAADWDRRFRAWRMGQPIVPADEFEAYAPAFTSDSIADVKRFLRTNSTGPR